MNHVNDASKNEDTTPSVMELLEHMDYANIPISRLEELVRAETQLDIVLRAHQTLDVHSIDAVLQSVFGSKTENDSDLF